MTERKDDRLEKSAQISPVSVGGLSFLDQENGRELGDADRELFFSAAGEAIDIPTTVPAT